MYLITSEGENDLEFSEQEYAYKFENKWNPETARASTFVRHIKFIGLAIIIIILSWNWPSTHMPFWTG